MHQALVHVFSDSPLCLGHNAMKEASDTKDFLANYIVHHKLILRVMFMEVMSELVVSPSVHRACTMTAFL